MACKNNLSISRGTRLSELPDVLTTKECMVFLKIGRNSLYKLLKDGILGSVKVGRKYIIPKSSLEKYLSLWYNGSKDSPVSDKERSKL